MRYMASESQDGAPSGHGAAPLGRGRALLIQATVFASGAAVMIVEMTAVRTMQPFFGSTTYVWTNVIAVVLAALAVGYAVGGRLADRFPSPRLLYLLLASGGVFVALAALLATPVSLIFLEEGVDLEGVVSILLWGSLGATLLLFAPPILLLGTITPLAIRLLARRGVGRAAGSVFALSTFGSILGTYLPTLWLVPRLGSRGSILVAAGILLSAAAVGLFAFGRRSSRALAWLVFLAAGTASMAAARHLVTPDRPAPLLADGSATLLAEVESPYQYLTVRDDEGPHAAARVLTINEGVYSFHALRVRGRVLTGSRFYDAYSVLPFLLDLEPGDPLRACVVGLACGVGASQWHHFLTPLFDLHVVGAELDPEVLRLGRHYFDLPPEGSDWLRSLAVDGRSHLEWTIPTDPYQIIVVDAFANELYVPFHLATREFFDVCRRRLTDDGLLAMNVHAYDHTAPNLEAIENTMASVFTHVVRIPHYETGGFLLLARKGSVGVDPGRLRRGPLLRRYQGWDGFDAWCAEAESGGLMALADDVATSAAAGGHDVVFRRDAPLLTDDHAPLAWMTDRFLWEAEEGMLRAGNTRAGALHALRSRQTGLLMVILAGWALLLAGLVRLGRTRHRASLRACARE